MVKAKLPESQGQVGQRDLGEKDGDTHSLTNGCQLAPDDHIRA